MPIPPLPPIQLMRSVGSTDPHHYDNSSGAEVFSQYGDFDYTSFFDFGCGCGRVARQLMQQKKSTSRISRGRSSPRIDRLVPDCAPLIVAGDFNDWRHLADAGLARPLGLKEVFEDTHGRPARSFPAAMPFLRLDRIYVRGFEIEHVHVHHGHPWQRFSDHAALTASITRA